MFIIDNTAWGPGPRLDLGAFAPGGGPGGEAPGSSEDIGNLGHETEKINCL